MTHGDADWLQSPTGVTDSFAVDDPQLTVNRWRRFGMDRLYVEVPDGPKVGWWDLATDEAHPESPEDLARLTASVVRWRADHHVPAPVVDEPEDESAAQEEAVAPIVPEPDPQPAAVDVTPERPWLDLAGNLAGAQARDQARTARAAAPVKSTLARVLGVHTTERAWRIGADGEELVAAQLGKLVKKDPRWRFLHAIPVGTRGSDIDHLVIGPGGVFTVNAKHHPKADIWVGGSTVMVNGQRQPYVRNSRHEATRAARLLSEACGFGVHVEGLIVTVNASTFVVKSQPDGVSVTWRNNLAKWLLQHGDILDEVAVEAIYEQARRSTTWR